MENIRTIIEHNENPQNDKKLGDALSYIIQDDLRNSFKTSLQNDFGIVKQKKKSFKVFRLVGAIAASIALILVATIFLKTSPSYDTLVADHITTTLEHPGMLKGTNVQQREIAVFAYNKQNWPLSIRSFNNIAEPTATDLFYKSLAHFYNKDFEQALKELNALPASNYTQEVTWFKALALLEMNKLKDAKSMLLSIEANAWKYQEAQELLQTKRLKSIE